MRHPKISVIIPCYNVERYVQQCLESVLYQTIGMENLEIIAINDASTDGTLEILLDYEKQNTEHMTVINLPKNQKQGTARNIGMQYAKGDYIGFVDSDDWIEPQMYEKLYEKAVLYDCDLVSCGLLRDYTDGRSMSFGGEIEGVVKRDKNVLEGNTLIETQEGSIVTKIFKKSLILDHELWFPEKIYYEDNYWYPIVLLYIRNYYLINQYYYHYRENLNSTLMLDDDDRLFDRLIIEKMKLKKLEEMKVRERFFDRIEIDFIHMYYTNTLISIARHFKKIPYKRFLDICDEIREECPNYKINPYLETPRFRIDKIMIQMIEMNLSQEELEQIIEEWKKSERL
ncbi:MAG: glycosyltransferase [Lachnospiraceae bacterium]